MFSFKKYILWKKQFRRMFTIKQTNRQVRNKKTRNGSRKYADETIAIIITYKAKEKREEKRETRKKRRNKKDRKKTCIAEVVMGSVLVI